MSFRVLGYLLSNRVIEGFILLVFVVLAATGGYMIIEGWSLLDALYMAVISVTTVGYSEVHPLSTEGQVFTLFVVLIGVGIAFYILTAMVAAIIEGEFSQVLDRGRLRLAVRDLKDHYIVCGFGRVGWEVARELEERQVPLVVVDASEPAVDRAREAGFLTVLGDATDEDVLREAGIERASNLFAATDSDSINTFITLAARGANRNVGIVSRMGSPAVEQKLRQAGADRVVSPYSIGGRRMAFAALQPRVTDFVDLFSDDPLGERVLAEVPVSEESGLAGEMLSVALEKASDVVVLALRGLDGQLSVGPPPSRVLQAGEVMIVVGPEAGVAAIGNPRAAAASALALGDNMSLLSRVGSLLRRGSGR